MVGTPPVFKLPTPLIVIGLDSAEAVVLATGPDDDRFPTLAGLRHRGAHGRLPDRARPSRPARAGVDRRNPGGGLTVDTLRR